MEGILVTIIPNTNGTPAGKLADAEVYFTRGALEGLKLVGFGIWERPNAATRHVTFPTRRYVANGERRSYSLLRPIADGGEADKRVRDLLLEAYLHFEQERLPT